MKKNYLIVMFSAIAVSTAFGQVQQKQAQLHNADNLNAKPNAVNNNSEKVIYWSEDFANGLNSANGTWTTGGVDGGEWKHSFYTTSGSYSTNTPDFASTSAANGYMLWDEDSINTADNGFQMPSNWTNHTGELISPDIDLTTYGGIILELEQDFRYCCAAGGHQLHVSISSDGGTTWGLPIDLTDGAGSNEAWLTYNNQTYLTQKNITSEAAYSTIRLKFTWDGNTSGDLAYYWAIDDIRIVEWPVDDVQLMSAWVAGVNNDGLEYGRTPYNMQETDYYIGSQVYNWGSATQNNLSLSAVFNGFSSSSTHPSLMNDSTVIMESTEVGVGPLPVNLYTGDYTVVSDAETGGTFFDNNVGLREFEVTESMTWGTCGSRYSLDGIDVYSSSNLASVGTSGLVDGEDGLMVGTMYFIKEDMPVDGIEMLISSSSVPEANFRAFITDTASFFAGDFTSPLFESDYQYLTQADVDAGVVNIPLLDAGGTLPAGVYYVCVELNSSAGAFHIRILDDRVVAQPWYASVIYITNGTNPGAGSNGNATAIRLAYDCLGYEENNLEGIKIFPNPSEGIINVTNANGYENTIVVYDLAGQVVSTVETSSDAVLDLSGAGSGVYVVKVSSANGTFVERVILK